MSLLDSLTTGLKKEPRRTVLYGVEGIGKSTFAAQAEKVIFIKTEDGLNDIDTTSFPLCETWDDVENQLSTLCQEDHDFKNLAVDSADWLERLIFEKVAKDAKVNSIDEIGYGKGFGLAVTYWREFLNACNYLRKEKQMGLIILAHSAIEHFESPDVEPYDRYTPALHKKSNPLLREWADEVLFANYKIYTKEAGDGFGKKKYKALDKTDRVLKTTERPSHMAKNRLGLPDELPLVYAEYEKFIK